MFGTGFLSGLAGKLAGLGLPAKLLMALGITLTGVTAGAGAGALPAPVQSTVAGVVNTVTPFQFPGGHTGGSAQVVVAAPSVGQTGVQVDAGAGTGDDHSGANVNANAGTPAGGVNVHASAADATPTPDVDVPPVDPSTLLSHLPVSIPSCVTSIVDSAGHVVASPSALASQVLSCVNQLIPAGVVPPSVSNCISSILGSVGSSVGTGVPTSIPQINVSACVPVDVSQCASSIMSQFGNPAAILGNLSKFGSLFGFSSLTNLTSLANLHGCVPFNLDTCISSILGSAPGGMAKLNLSSCVPANLIGNLPMPFGH